MVELASLVGFGLDSGAVVVADPIAGIIIAVPSGRDEWHGEERLSSGSSVLKGMVM